MKKRPRQSLMQSRNTHTLKKMPNRHGDRLLQCRNVTIMGSDGTANCKDVNGNIMYRLLPAPANLFDCEFFNVSKCDYCIRVCAQLYARSYINVAKRSWHVQN